MSAKRISPVNARFISVYGLSGSELLTDWLGISVEMVLLSEVLVSELMISELFPLITISLSVELVLSELMEDA